jgi:DNA polymerase I
VLEVATQAIPEVSRSLCECMTGVAELTVPLVVEVGVGDNWDEAH